MPCIRNGGFNRSSASAALKDGEADAIAFGTPFIANPDLVERFVADADLNPLDAAMLYVAGAQGYTDYPALTSSAYTHRAATIA